MNKMKIYEFDPVIYPRKLWVVKGGTTKDIKNSFYERDHNELDLENFEKYGAITAEVESKDNAKFGELIWFPNVAHLTVSNIAHEATHAALNIGMDIGMRIDRYNDEPLAYLVGWIAACMDKVRTNKAKEKKQ